MMLKARFQPAVTLFAFMVLASFAQGQVMIQGLQVDGTDLSQAGLYRLVVSNASEPARASIEGSIRTRSGTSVLTWKSRSFLLPSGTQTINSATAGFEVLQFASNEVGRAAELKRRLPGGTYQVCVTIRTEAEGADDLCEDFEVDHLLVLDHVYPMDRDTIDEVRPTCMWTYSGEVVPSSGGYFRYGLFPLRTGSSAALAVASETPLFALTEDLQQAVPFPTGPADLQRGSWYAWQVDYVENGRVVERAEPTSFFIRNRVEPQPNKYVRIDQDQGGRIYEVVDQRIYFRYDEPYSSEGMDCTILTGEQTLIKPVVTGDENSGSTGAGIRSVGVNLYELDLQPYSLSKGYYDLVVRNEKGRTDRLKFHIAK